MSKKNSEKQDKKKDNKIDIPLKLKDYYYFLLGLVFPGLGHFILKRKKRAYIFAASILVMFVLGLLMEGRMFVFGRASGWLEILGIFAMMAAGIPYFIAWIFGLGYGNAANILEPYGNYFILAAGLLNILIALDAMDISAGRKK